ncbi:MAG: TonB-dependent receptor [Deltaproteobacteria bacterium]|nr:TonB-dependent receptor [Deltaproteobacteria bacterium]
MGPPHAVRASVTLAVLGGAPWALGQPRPTTNTPGETELDRAAQEVVVRAPSGARERLGETPRSVSADSRLEAVRAVARDVGDRLEELPGVYVQRTTSMSAAPILRGLGGQRTLLLFDGLRLNDALTRVGGNALLTLIDPAVVRSVEVVRGPASVLHGSDALGGVVLVNPLDASGYPGGEREAHGEVSLRQATAERSVQATGLVEGEAGPFGALLSGSLGDTGRLQAGGPLGEQPYSGYGDRAASLRGTWTPSSGHRLGVALHTSAITDAPRSDLSSPGDLRVFRLQRRDVGYLHYQGGIGPARVSARAGLLRRDEVRDRLREARTDTERDSVLSAQAALQVDLRVRQARFSAGLDLASDAVDSATETLRDHRPPSAGRGRYLHGSRYTQGGLFAFWRQRFGASDRWTLEAGARLAFVSVQAPTDGSAPALERAYRAPVGGLGGRVALAPGVTLLVNLLGGFRAPNLDDYQALGSGARSFDVPNPDLGPERSWTAELGLRAQRRAFSLTAFVYGSTLQGLVARVPSTFQGMTMVDGRRVYTRQNANDASLLGAELDLGWRPTAGLQATLGGAFTWAEATLPLEDGTRVIEPMARVPPAFGRLTLGWRWPRAWVTLVLTGALPQPRLATSDRDDVRLCPAGPARCTEVPGYGAVGLRAGAHLHPRLTLSTALENVFDSAYTPYGAGLPAPGLNLVVALRAQTN